MLKLIIIINFLFTSKVLAECAIINKNILNKNQIELCSLIDKNAKSFGLVKTITAIAKIESNLGQYNINLQDPSCSFLHIHLKTYLKRHNIKDNPFNRNKHCQELINNPKLAIANAIEELLFWKSIHCSKSGCDIVQYQNVVKSYNAGWNYSSKKANKYYKRFKKAYKELYGD